MAAAAVGTISFAIRDGLPGLAPLEPVIEENDMLRSILVALDGSPSSMNAARAALEIARRNDAHVEGLGIVNSAWIQRPEAVPAGAMAFKRALDLQEMEDAAQRIEAVLQHFGEEARKAGIASVAARRIDGAPFRMLEAEAVAHDLITVGRHSMFDMDGEMCQLPLCVDQIIRSQPRPVLLLPDSQALPEPADLSAPVLVAFDGSPASSRAVHMYALLGLAKKRAVHVVTLDEASAARAGETADRACALLRLHGAAEAHPIGLGDREAGTPAETILGLAKALRVETIVMGAYGHRGVREIFGSCTKRVLNDSPTALFLYH